MGQRSDVGPPFRVWSARDGVRGGARIGIDVGKEGVGGGSCESSEFLSREMSWIEGIVGDDGGMVLVWRLGVKATL